MRYQKLCPQKGNLWGRYLCQGLRMGLSLTWLVCSCARGQDNVEEEFIVSC